MRTKTRATDYAKRLAKEVRTGRLKLKELEYIMKFVKQSQTLNDAKDEM